jgi:glycosyltransferase involved in cell wall biosynthesis
MSACLVTIGIPCYNGERWIRQCVESALAQTWAAREVIVVDDGSTDGSRAMLSGFGDAIRVLEGAHRGANHARNEVLAQARGEWLQFLDADDYLEPQKIAQQFAEARDGADVDVIVGPVWIEENGARTASELDPQLDRWTQWLAWQLPQTGGCLWRKQALDALGGWKENQPCCQEHELYLRALKSGLRFVFAPTPHAVYRVWSDDTLCRKDPRLVIEVKTALIDDAQAWMAERNLWTEAHRRIAGRACFEMARTLAKFDLAAAAAYHAERKSRRLIHLDGPAAPKLYRFTYYALGFPMAEKFAAARR